jgi:hypothetical protein
MDHGCGRKTSCEVVLVAKSQFEVHEDCPKFVGLVAPAAEVSSNSPSTTATMEMTEASKNHHSILGVVDEREENQARVKPKAWAQASNETEREPPKIAQRLVDEAGVSGRLIRVDFHDGEVRA